MFKITSHAGPSRCSELAYKVEDSGKENEGRSKSTVWKCSNRKCETRKFRKFLTYAVWFWYLLDVVTENQGHGSRSRVGVEVRVKVRGGLGIRFFVSEWTGEEEKWTTASVQLDRPRQQAAWKSLRLNRRTFCLKSSFAFLTRQQTRSVNALHFPSCQDRRLRCLLSVSSVYNALTSLYWASAAHDFVQAPSSG